MAGHSPTIFISSTFYDLRQVRADLFHFIEDQLGYRALASEHVSFPVDPDIDTIENCRERVQKDADCMVLIVGSRYGSIPAKLSKSVTNLEYEIARAKGIPIYTFIQKEILAILPAWESNPDADFSKIVDSPALFLFINNIRSSGRQWTFPFDTAQDIVNVLRNQFAYLMMSGLELQKRLFDKGNILNDLSGKPLKIAIEQVDGWQGRLFGQAIIDEIHSRRELKREFETGISLGPGENVEASDYNEWTQLRIAEVLRLFSAINRTVDKLLHDAFATDDIDTIIYGARQIGRIYEEAIKWSQRVRRARVPEFFENLTEEISLVTKQLIRQTEDFGPRLVEEIDRILQSDSGEKIVRLTFKIDVENAEQLNSKLKDAYERYENELS